MEDLHLIRFRNSFPHKSQSDASQQETSVTKK